MNKKPNLTDEDIRKMMDFDGLIKQHATLASQSTKLKKAIFICTGTGLIFLSGYLFWTAQNRKPLNTQPQSLERIEKVNPSQPIIPENKNPDAVARQAPIAKSQGISQNKMNQPPANKTETTISAASYTEAEPVSGFPKLYEYLNRQIIYPKQMANDSIQGVESVSLAVDENGEIGYVTILHSLGKSFDDEANRLLNDMPPWKSALLNGKPVASRVTLPLTFAIQSSRK